MLRRQCLQHTTHAGQRSGSASCCPLSAKLASRRSRAHSTAVIPARVHNRAPSSRLGLLSSQLQATLAPEAPAWAPTEEIWEGDREAQYKELLQRFEAADTNHNGRIDKDELKALLERVNCGATDTITGWVTDDTVAKVMEQYDTDNSGDIDFEEFQVLARDKVLLKGKLDEYELAFNAVDKGGNGKVGASELAQLFQDLGHPVTYERLVEIMKQYDVDKSGEIEFGEFLRMFSTELLDLQEVLKYLHSDHTPEEPREQPQRFPGEVNLLFSEKELDDVLKEEASSLVVLMSTVTWCRPCKGMQKAVQDLAEHYKTGAHILKLYGNSNDECKYLFKDRLLTRVTPTFFMFRNGEIIHSHTGANKMKLEYYMRQHLPPLGEVPKILFPVKQQPTGGFK